MSGLRVHAVRRACCGLSDQEHSITCHDCGSTSTPIEPDATLQRGEPICTTCARHGAAD